MKNLKTSFLLLFLILISSNSIISKNVILSQNKQKKNIIYRIQIAASRQKLSNIKLNQIYPVANRLPDHKIMVVDMDDNWYKYLVGDYKTYEEADAIRLQMSVEGAFIVAYKNYGRVRNISEVCSPDNHPASRN